MNCASAQRAAGEIRSPAPFTRGAVAERAHLTLPEDLARVSLSGRSLACLEGEKGSSARNHVLMAGNRTPRKSSASMVGAPFERRQTSYGDLESRPAVGIAAAENTWHSPVHAVKMSRRKMAMRIHGGSGGAGSRDPRRGGGSRSAAARN